MLGAKTGKQKEQGPSPVRQYLVALLAPAVIAGFMQLTWPLLKDSPAGLFLLAIAFCSWYGGLRAGLVSTVVSFLLADYFFLAPYFSLGHVSPSEFTRVTVLVAVGVFMSVLTELLHRERARSEKNVHILRASEERYRKLAENFPNGGVLTYDRDLRITFIAGRGLQEQGFTAESFMGKSLDEIAPPEVVAIVEPHFRAAFAGQTEVYECPYPDGRVYFAAVAPLLDENGVITEILVISQDITGRKHAERELSKLAAIVESSDDAIIGKTLEGVITSWNKGASKVYGYTAEEVVGRSISILVPPDHPDEVTTILEKVRRGKAVEHYETKRITKDGRIINVSLTVSPIKSAGGAVIGASAIARDITESKRSQEELSASEARFRQLLDSSITGVVFWTLSGEILDANDLFLGMIGYSREDLRQGRLNWKNITPPEYADVDEKAIREMMETGACSPFEKEYVRKDGSRVSVLIGSALFDQKTLVFVEPVTLKGEQCLLSTAYDITDRRQVEAALRESEERYRELFENAKDAIYVHDLSGRYISVNRAAEKLSGYSRAEIIGKHYSNFMAPRHLKHARTNLVKKLDEVPETSYEIDLITKDRRRVPVEVNSRLIYENGVPVGVQGTARDITERQLAEQARAQLALIVESSHDAIIGKTLDGTIVSWNSGAAKIYGYLAEEVIGRSVSLLIPPEHRDDLPRIMEILRRGESIKNYETIRRTKGGNVIDVSLTISPIRDSLQNLVGASTIARDITSSKQAEKGLKTFSRRLIEAQEAERQNIARELHDEIGQVLTAVRINLQSIQRSGLADQNNPRLDESVAIVDEALGRVRDLSIELRPALLDDLGVITD